MDAFISHTSRDRDVAVWLESALEAQGLEVWLDDSDIHVGALLRGELQTAVARSAALVLLWSESAAQSRWVEAEWLTAINLSRPVLSCTLDDTPLPQCLRCAVRLDRRRDADTLAARLGRAVRQAAGSPTPLAPVIRSAPQELRDQIATIGREQEQLLERIGAGSLEQAAQLQRALDDRMAHARTRWPLDPELVTLDGYHLKNAYMVRHWAAIEAGRPPQDPLLDQAESRFFETLTVDPMDPGALNGLGSILRLELELEAAEFFILAALSAANKRGITRYEAAESDLAAIRDFKSRSGMPAWRLQEVERALFVGDVTPAAQFDLQRELAAFHDYLAAIDPRLSVRVPTVRISDDDATAYYDESRNEAVISSAISDDADVLYREYTHHVLTSVARVAFSDMSAGAQAVESALADYLPCSYAGHAQFGERAASVLAAQSGGTFTALRDLDNGRRFDEIHEDTPFQYAGEIWGGAFWSIRQQVGRESLDAVLLNAWTTWGLGPRDATTTGFAEQLMRTVADRAPALVTAMGRELAARGAPVGPAG